MPSEDPWLQDDDELVDAPPPSLSRLPFLARDWPDAVYDLLPGVVEGDDDLWLDDDEADEDY
jgi:hypothetical protein